MVAPSKQRGLSLIELLVGVALGLMVIASAGAWFVTQSASHTRLVESSRVSHELRASADVIARDLRRAGHWRAALRGVSLTPIANVYQNVSPSPQDGATPDVAYSYSRDDGADNNAIDTQGTNEAFGFELRDGVIRSRVGGTLQALTDSGSVHITRLQVTPRHLEISMGDRCYNASGTVATGCCRPHDGDASRCKPRVVERTGTGVMPPLGAAPTGSMRITPACPEMVVRRYDIVIRGRAASRVDEPEQEAMQTVLVRNDQVRATSCPSS